MKRLFTLAVLAAVGTVLAFAPVVLAVDVQGKIKSMDASGRMLTLDDGTRLTIPATVKVERKDLKPGADVKANYEDKDGQMVVTSIEVRPTAPEKK